MTPDAKEIRRILVVTLSNLGDVILTLPVLQSLHANFPKAELHVVVSASAAEVFQGDGRIAKVILYDKRSDWRKKIDFIKGIRREKYSLIVDLRRSLIGLLGGSRFRNSYFNFSQRTIHRTKKHLSALDNILGRNTADISFLKVSSPETLAKNAYIRNDQKLVVASVGSKSDVKKWPAEYFAGLLDRLAVNDHCQIVLIGDKHDVPDAQKVRSLMQSSVIDLCGRTNFKELCGVLKMASLVITNDSAPLHIADSLKIPVLAIFGPTDPRKYGPRHAGSMAVRKDLFCSPCEKAQCRYDHECMKDLGIEEVYQKCLQILNDEFQPKNLKILMIRLDRIGDVVLSLPAVQAVRDRFPNATISMMVRPYTRAIVDGHPAIDEVIEYDYEKNGRHGGLIGNIRFLREIIKRHFDIAFILNPSNRSYNLPFLAGIPYRIGFRSRFPFLLTQSISDRRHEGSKQESEYTLDIVKAFGIDQPATLPKLNITPYDNLLLSKLLERRGCTSTAELIALHPGASCASKRWPVKYFAELGKKILDETSYQIVVIGGPYEKSTGEVLKKELGERSTDLTGALDLKMLSTLLSRCRLLISNDSGPVHIAAAVGTKTLTIFGRNQAGLSPVRWRALGKGHAVIQKDVGCVVCLAHRCAINFECLRAIEPEEVYKIFSQMISGSDRKFLDLEQTATAGF